MAEERKTIMLVDDDQVHLNAGKNILKSFYNVFPIPSGSHLFEMLKKITPDLILLDIEMPDMDGYEVIKRLKGDAKTADVPVIFLSAHIDPNHELEGLALGAVDYIFKPFSPILLIRRIETHMTLAMQKKDPQSENSPPASGSYISTDLNSAILNIFADLVESRVEGTGHTLRTQNYVRVLLEHIIAKNIYPDETAGWAPENLAASSRFHDIGKIRISAKILSKPDKLTPEEFGNIKNHVQFGAKIIENMEKMVKGHAFLLDAKKFTAAHHEKWDGTGYPSGLKGEAIPLHGRIMAIADVYDALI
jgi:putative two-component system response regulator